MLLDVKLAERSSSNLVKYESNVYYALKIYLKTASAFDIPHTFHIRFFEGFKGQRSKLLQVLQRSQSSASHQVK
jgi:hypothetical protein